MTKKILNKIKYVVVFILVWGCMLNGLNAIFSESERIFIIILVIVGLIVSGIMAAGFTHWLLEKDE